jgi:Glyoxalase superfamily protein
MDIRLPQPKAAAKILKDALAQMGVSVQNMQALELVAKTYGYNDWYSMQKDTRFTEPLTLKATSFDEYELSVAPGSGAWIAAQNISVRVFVDESGVAVSLYPKGEEMEPELGYVRVAFEDATADRRAPLPNEPFHACKLPYDFRAVEWVSLDERGLAQRKCCTVSSVNNSVIEWLNAGALSNDADLSEEFLSYDEEGRFGESLSLSTQDLYEATLASNGRFTLKDGRELFLIDAQSQRWYPKDRI